MTRVKAPRQFISGFCNPTMSRTPIDSHPLCRGCDCRADGCPCNPATHTQETPVADTPIDIDLQLALVNLELAADALNTAMKGYEPPWLDALDDLAKLRRATALLSSLDALIVKHLYLKGEYGKRTIDGLGEVWITRTRDGEKWATTEAVREYVAQKILANDGEMPDPDQVLEWVLEVVPASKLRVTPLRAVGLDVDEYRTSTPGKPSVTLPKPDLMAEGGV